MAHDRTEPPVPTTAAVANRLEEILPGLRRFATESAAAAYALKQEIWQRVHPGRPPLGALVTWEIATLDVDQILDHAHGLGVPVTRVPNDQLGVLLEDELFYVSDDNVCERVSGPRLDAVAREVTPGGRIHGDALFVWVAAPRVIVVHHGGYIFDVRPARDAD